MRVFWAQPRIGGTHVGGLLPPRPSLLAVAQTRGPEATLRERQPSCTRLLGGQGPPAPGRQHPASEEPCALGEWATGRSTQPKFHPTSGASTQLQRQARESTVVNGAQALRGTSSAPQIVAETHPVSNWCRGRSWRWLLGQSGWPPGRPVAGIRRESRRRTHRPAPNKGTGPISSGQAGLRFRPEPADPQPRQQAGSRPLALFSGFLVFTSEMSGRKTRELPGLL